MPAAPFDRYDSLQRDDAYVEELSSNIWLMDNHKWALWVWEQYREHSSVKRFTLVHADYHWDGGYDPHEESDIEDKILKADSEHLRRLIAEDVWIRYDSFIVPAVKRNLFDEIHFFCKQDDGFDVGIDEDLLSRQDVKQVLHDEATSLTAHAYPSPLIFDLCLDLFNRSTQFCEGDLWSDNEILAFLEIVRPLIVRAVVVTVSLSFECSGTEDDTRRLAKLVLPVIEGWRRDIHNQQSSHEGG